MVKSISKSNSNVLNFIRGISAQLVVLGHLLSFFLFQEVYKIPGIQNFGVIVFFVLSGYLITQVSIFKKVEYGFKNYLIDRFSRIFYTFIPALFLVCFIDLVLIYYFKIYETGFVFNVSNFISNALMLQSFPLINFLGIEAFGSARPFWTVAIEFWFYIFFGFIFFQKYNKFNLALFILIMISFIFVIFYINGRGSGLSIFWFFGFLVAIINNKFEFVLKRKHHLFLILLVAFSLVFRSLFHLTMYDTGIAFLFSCLLFLILRLPDDSMKFLTSKIFSKVSYFLASYSYSLYLVHYSLIILFRNYFSKDLDVLGLIIIFFLVNIIAYAFYLIFEKNNVKLRNKLKNIF